jgi:hypothetical protein
MVNFTKSTNGKFQLEDVIGVFADVESIFTIKIILTIKNYNFNNFL